MNVNKRLKIAGFFLTLSEWDRHIEVIRQILNSLDRFEPYAAFLRITKGRENAIRSQDVCEFLQENGVKTDEKLVAMMIRLYDTNFTNSLNFEDFLKMILTRDNPDMRFESALRPNYDVVGLENVLSEEIEYTLARFFKKACEFLQKMINDQETQRLIDDNTIFSEVDTKKSRRIDFSNLKAFFESSKIVPRDSEIISILRVIDINDDGIITEIEFNFFIELFSKRDPSDLIIGKLKELKSKDPVLTHSSRVEEAEERKPSFAQRAPNYTPTTKEHRKSPSRNLEEESKVADFVRTQPIDSKNGLSSGYDSRNYRSRDPGLQNRSSERPVEQFSRTSDLRKQLNPDAGIPRRPEEARKSPLQAPSSDWRTETTPHSAVMRESRRESKTHHDSSKPTNHRYEEKVERTRTPEGEEEVITKKTTSTVG